MADITATIEQLANEAQARCGLNYELYVDLFSADVNRFMATLSEDEREVAEQAARQNDYSSPSEQAKYEFGDNECIHHFVYDTCPLGCGELDTADRPF